MNTLRKRMGRILSAALLAGLGLLGGCGSTPRGDYMALEFKLENILNYRFVSSRQVQIELTTGAGGKKEDSKISHETLEMVMQVKPLKVDPYGLSTIEFTCRSVQVKRTSFSGKAAPADAMESLKGKSYTIQITPTGQIENIESFTKLLKETGQKSFVARSDTQQNVKDPDMILDWICFQFYLWDVTASNPKPVAGVRPGSTWKSDQFMPWPVPIQNLPSRVTTYTVKEITEQDGRRLAHIDSAYQLREKPVLNFPLPYEGSYQIKGSLFSVLRNYQHQSLEGSGTQIFNLTDGFPEKDQQDYTLVTRADFILPLGQSLPTLTVQQSILIERLNDGPSERITGGSQ
jgi:hypothetical protein